MPKKSSKVHRKPALFSLSNAEESPFKYVLTDVGADYSYVEVCLKPKRSHVKSVLTDVGAEEKSHRFF